MSKDVAVIKRRKAVLVLEDGTIFRGVGFRASKKTYGEVVFNTGMVGYPEAITDPSYKEQILVQPFPLIDSYAVCLSVFESNEPKIEGCVIRELCRHPNHWPSELGLDRWLTENGIPGIEAIETRMLTKHLRERGIMLAILHICDDLSEKQINKLKEEVNHIIHSNTQKLAYMVATDTMKTFKGGYLA